MADTLDQTDMQILKTLQKKLETHHQGTGRRGASHSDTGHVADYH